MRSKRYMIIILVLMALGLPTRFFSSYLPRWYVNYAGDFLWAMLIFFLCCLLFRLKTQKSLFVASFIVCCIECSQLFHPPWLEYLRSIKVFSLILGFDFSWTDIAVYSMGLSLAALINLQFTKAMN